MEFFLFFENIYYFQFINEKVMIFIFKRYKNKRLGYKNMLIDVYVSIIVIDQVFFIKV